MVSEYRPVWILVIGFVLVIMTLALMGWLGLRQTESIRRKASLLVAEHLYTARLVDELEREQQRASAVLLGAVRIAAAPTARPRVLAELSALEARYLR